MASWDPLLGAVGLLVDSGHRPYTVAEHLVGTFKEDRINIFSMLILCVPRGVLFCFYGQKSSLLLVSTCSELGHQSLTQVYPVSI